MTSCLPPVTLHWRGLTIFPSFCSVHCPQLWSKDMVPVCVWPPCLQETWTKTPSGRLGPNLTHSVLSTTFSSSWPPLQSFFFPYLVKDFHLFLYNSTLLLFLYNSASPRPSKLLALWSKIRFTCSQRPPNLHGPFDIKKSYQVWWVGGIYSVDTLDTGRIRVWAGRAVQCRLSCYLEWWEFKTYELFISRVSQLILLLLGWRQVTEPIETKAAGKEVLLYLPPHFL